jgi:hypothetical protein
MGMHLMERVSYGRVPSWADASLSVHLVSIYLMGVHLMGVYLIGVCLIGVYLTERALHGCASHRVCTSWACSL